jgi:hypothetical protein
MLAGTGAMTGNVEKSKIKSVSPPFLIYSNETTVTLDACGLCRSMPISYASDQIGEKEQNTSHENIRK